MFLGLLVLVTHQTFGKNKKREGEKKNKAGNRTEIETIKTHYVLQLHFVLYVKGKHLQKIILFLFYFSIF